jgi:hypothetical protein
MKQKIWYLAAFTGILTAASLLPSCKSVETRSQAALQAAQNSQELASGEVNSNSLLHSGRYFTTDNNANQFVENGRRIAQNRKASGSRKAKKPAKKKSSLLPGQFPESSERLLTEKDVEHQTPWGMKVMLNEIYARQGYKFREADLRKHFAKEKWYRGREKSLNKIKLTPIEIQNIAFIKRYQRNAKI